MEMSEINKRNFFKKYHDSDIFNIKIDSNTNRTDKHLRYKTAQSSLEKTKNDLFNTAGKNNDSTKTKPLKRRKINLQNYKSDIFNLNEQKNNKKSTQRINPNQSTCFDGIKNNEEYNKALKDYTLKHRAKLKKYNIEKYFNDESAISRYYKELYGDEKSGIFPEKAKLNKTTKNSPSFKNNMDNFENRKKKLKKQLNEINDVGVDGKKKPGEHLGQEIDGKGNKRIYNKRKIDIYGQNLDNNKKIFKEKNHLGFNPKLHKQLENQSNIFNEQNKDINKTMTDFIYKKMKEKENEKIINERIKKEKEDMDKKINELKKQNLNEDNPKLQPTNMKWTDTKAQILFKKTYTTGDLNNNNQKDISAFERKMKDLSDSNNIDILSKNKKSINIKNLKKNININNDDNNREKIYEILDTFPDNNLREDQKISIINKSTTSNFLNNSKNDENIKKFYNTISNNIKSARHSKNKKKNDNIIKIMGKNSKINNKTTNNSLNKDKDKVHDYTLVYSTKNSKIDKFGNNDIKRIFGKKGVHIYDVKKNELSVGDLNSIKFKVRETDENNENNIDEKMKLIEEDFIKNKYKVNINKDEKKKITKDNRNQNEKEKKKFTKTPFKSKGNKNFTSQFPKADLKYKNMVKK